jgi:hypothetical protein
MSEQRMPTQVTDLQGIQPIARECIQRTIEQMTGSTDMSFDFYREWNGAWRVDVEVRGPISGAMDFILFHTPQGGILAMPAQVPERWRSSGIEASDGSRWSFDDEGMLCAVEPASE